MKARDDQNLLRAIGRWDLLALAINGIVGAGIFGLPSKVDALLGANALWAIVACAAVIGLIILCFAEVASRFVETGGPLVYATSAFGPLAGFMTGWVLWVARVTGCCAILSLFLQYAGYFLPNINRSPGRTVAIVVVVGTLTLVQYFGVKRAVLLGNIVTVGKLLPLLLFVGFGLLHLDFTRFSASAPAVTGHFAQGMLLLGFALVGWESVVVTAGETLNPQRDLPFALIAGLSVVTALYLLIQVVCIGTLPGLSTSDRPVVDAAQTFLGPQGATLIGVGALLSMLGTLNVTMLTVSRVPYALALAGHLPRALGVVHPRHHTPYVAVVLSGVLVLALTLTSSFVYLLTVSTISRLSVFAVTCASLPQLRRKNDVPPALFIVPGGVVIPGVSVMLIAWLLASSSWVEGRDVTISIFLGGLVYATGRWQRGVQS